MIETEDLISLRSKRVEHAYSFLTVAQARRLFWPAVVLEPAAFLLAGMMVFLWRRVQG